MANPESLKMHRFRNIFHDFFGGMGNVGSPESLQMHGFLNFVTDFFNGVGSPENAKISYMFHVFFRNPFWRAFVAPKVPIYAPKVDSCLRQHARPGPRKVRVPTVEILE